MNEFKRQGRLHLAIYGSRPKRMIIQIVCYDVMTDVSDKMKEWLEMFCDGATKQQLEVLKANYKKTFSLQVFPGHPRKRPAAAQASGGGGGAKSAPRRSVDVVQVQIVLVARHGDGERLFPRRRRDRAAGHRNDRGRDSSRGRPGHRLERARGRRRRGWQRRRAAVI